MFLLLIDWDIVHASILSYVRRFADYIVYQATLSMEFSSKNPEMGCCFLLQGVFPTQGLKLHL